MTAGDESDEALVARAGRGDRLAASTLVVRHSGRVFAVCRRMLSDRALAEDATQETFLRLWEKAHYWRPQGVRIETWLCRVATNACLDRLRKRRRETLTDEPPDAADPAPLAEATLMVDERREAVARALAALPERQRMAIVLCHYEQLTNIEAAQALNVSVDALESLLARGRRGLKDQLAPFRAELMEDVD